MLGLASGFISGVISAISSAVSSLGSTLSTFASSFLKIAGPYIGPLMQVIQAVAQILGILKSNEQPEELGDRAMRAEKQPEDFDTTAEYLDYLRNDVEFDKEEFNNLSDKDKMARSVVGTAILSKAISEKKEFDISLDTWVTLAKLNDKGLLSSKNVNEFLDEFKDTQIELNEYVDNKLKGKEEIEFESQIAKAYQKLEPELSPEDIYEKVLSAKVGN